EGTRETYRRLSLAAINRGADFGSSLPVECSGVPVPRRHARLRHLVMRQGKRDRIVEMTAHDVRRTDCMHEAHADAASTDRVGARPRVADRNYPGGDRS